jgi:hypothetical protein
MSTDDVITFIWVVCSILGTILTVVWGYRVMRALEAIAHSSPEGRAYLAGVTEQHPKLEPLLPKPDGERQRFLKP